MRDPTHGTVSSAGRSSPLPYDWSACVPACFSRLSEDEDQCDETAGCSKPNGNPLGKRRLQLSGPYGDHRKGNKKGGKREPGRKHRKSLEIQDGFRALH